MSSRDEQWWDLQAGELVLGTLDDHERDLFESIRKRDPEFQHRVTQWENRFAPLNQSLKPVKPPEQVWDAIEAKLGLRADQIDSRDSILNQTAALEKVQDAFNLEDISTDYVPLRVDRLGEDPFGTDSVEVHPIAAEPIEAHQGAEGITLPALGKTDTSVTQSLEQPPSRAGRATNIWRDLTVLASAACVVLAFIAWNAQYVKDQSPPSTLSASPQYDVISVVLNVESEPLWVVNAATEGGTLRISALAPNDPGSDKDYQLWLVNSENGVSSMGLMPAATGKTVLLEAPTFSEDGVAFAVSLEPKGGSPSPEPTGPVLYQGSIQKLDLSEIKNTL